ncbi:HAMP domain-containing histidine kinase [Martelella lutilitoris]|uniref:histidine kinase n=1 Tax=Martelella lutilitoris TaxID=2583532 RepID=A0A5C4JKN6_9HYPH|nr:HAMP domain-containing sensor histidine kinase [Martelella lutilitoris]TNB46073.1 HAMP domain-containing histidine kinase [Martelella lutilitoris]
MQKLFLNAFIMIWLAIACSLVGVLLVAYVSRATPYEEELLQRQSDFALTAAAGMLENSGPVAAREFIAVAGSPPLDVGLELTEAPDPNACVGSDNTGRERFIAVGATCYRLAADDLEQSLFSRLLPRSIPWVSAIIAAALAAFWLARYLTHPVQEIKIGLRALAEGRFSTRIGDRIDRKRDEIAGLAYDFDLTAERLEEFQDVQRRLFHDVSHELRSPLARLQVAISLLKKNPARMEAMADRLEREITRIDDLVEEILTLAKLNASEQLPLQRQTVDIIDLIADIIDDCRFESLTKNVTISYDGLSSSVATVNGELIYRAIENVIRNAVKYSPPSSEVAVAAIRRIDGLEIRVQDSGPGIPREHLKSIFRPFERVDTGGESQLGFGLGLSIAQRALHVHGGDIRADLNDNGGLSVVLRIPL